MYEQEIAALSEALRNLQNLQVTYPEIKEISQAKTEISNALNNYKVSALFQFGKILKVDSSRYVQLSDLETVFFFREKYHSISWPDQKETPKNEWVYKIQIATGAYCLSPMYPVELFNEMWEKILSYNPKYTDNHNNTAYFTPENAKEIYFNFKKILTEGKEKVASWEKQTRIAQLKTELIKLEGEENE